MWLFSLCQYLPYDHKISSHAITLKLTILHPTSSFITQVEQIDVVKIHTLNISILKFKFEFIIPMDYATIDKPYIHVKPYY